jgi:hypothetical protein
MMSLYTFSYLEKIKHSLLFFFLFFFSWCFTYKIPAVVHKHMWTPYSTVPLFNLGNI